MTAAWPRNKLDCHCATRVCAAGKAAEIPSFSSPCPGTFLSLFAGIRAGGHLEGSRAICQWKDPLNRKHLHLALVGFFLFFFSLFFFPSVISSKGRRFRSQNIFMLQIKSTIRIVLTIPKANSQFQTEETPKALKIYLNDIHSVGLIKFLHLEFATRLY